MWSFAFAPVAWWLLEAALAVVVISLIYGLNPVIRAASFENPPLPPEGVRKPSASVVVYSQGTEDELESCLQGIASQDYPDFEMIVVCDSSAQYAKMMGEKMAHIYEDLHVTFIPPGSHNLSRRKLATTIGAKAARGEIIVATIANVEIPSTQWLSSILAPFAGEEGESKDLSLGLTLMDSSELTVPGRWYRKFDTALSTASWISAACGNHPYRGDGYNIAFRRSTFFDHKGYAGTINLHYGDDDLFVCEVAKDDNWAVVAGPESILTTYWGEAADKVWEMRKEHYSFTSRWLPKRAFIRAGFQSAFQWIVPALCAGAAWLGWPSLVPLLAGALILLCFWGMEIFFYRRLAARLGLVKLWWGVVPFWLMRPVINFLLAIDHRKVRVKNFTWQRH